MGRGSVRGTRARGRTAGTWLVGMAVVSVLGAAACGDDGGDSGRDPDDGTTTTTSTASPDSTVDAEVRADVADPDLRAELLEMQEVDQDERTGEVAANNDRARTERLKEIIDEHGWPTFDLVGEDGAFAAWLIAQHSDQDVEFQQQALDLMGAAAEDGQADPSNLAYLEDRVAVNTGEDQRYGTQVSCTEDGEVAPSTPLVDPDHVDEWRAEVGLDPLANYYAEFEEGCL